METASALENAARRAFRPHRLSPAQFNVLNLLSDRPDGMRAGDLAARLVVHPSNVTRLLQKLKRDGLLVQVERPADRREVIVTLTPAGRTRWSKAHRVYFEAMRTIDRAIPAVAVRGASAVLQQLRDLSHELHR
jgi:DNA-binding MarR family transcriptional regulator